LKDVVSIINNGWEEVEKNKEKSSKKPNGEEVEKWRMVLARYVNPF
jgi:hypothetical protein